MNLNCGLLVEKTRGAFFPQVLVLVGFVFGSCSSWSYVGESFLQIPGYMGHGVGSGHDGSVRVDANYWDKKSSFAGVFDRPRAYYSGPKAPREGRGRLFIALNRNNPDVSHLMELCRKGDAQQRVIYSESSERSRTTFEVGPRPDGIPEYFSYELRNMRIDECPVVDDAPAQAFVISFDDIAWLNHDGNGIELSLEPSQVDISDANSNTRSYLVTWIAAANFVDDSQCPMVNSKPTEEDYYALMSELEAEEERKRLKEKDGGVDYENGQMGLRGPSGLDVTKLPGIVPDPGHHLADTSYARGIDLDGHSGSGNFPPDVCPHENYLSERGEPGVDNQQYRVQGCVQGWQGHKGFVLQFANNAMRDGLYSLLIQITDMDDSLNDDNVVVTVIYSNDPMVKSGSGDQVLRDFTFRVSADPHYQHFFSQHVGRIENGEVIVDHIPQFQLDLGPTGTPGYLKLEKAKMLLKLQSDGTLQGVIGGYRDWRELASIYETSTSEYYHGFQQPGLYNALRRAADGLKNPITGECDGISAAYDIEAIPAFITSNDHQIVRSLTE